MKNLNFKLLLLILIVGSSLAKGQNLSPNSVEYKTLKQQLMSGKLINSSQNETARNNTYGINDYGESPAFKLGRTIWWLWR